MPDFGDDMGNVTGRGSIAVARWLLRQIRNGNYQRHTAEISAGERQTICTLPFETAADRDQALQMIKERGISADAATIEKPAIAFRQADMGQINRILEERVKSHDSMDIDPFTAVKESVTQVKAEQNEYSWKEDIKARVADAREESNDLAQFIQNCEKRGLVVDRAKDGELMFVHPDFGHWKVRGDTLGEDYSRHAFKQKGHKPIKLDKEAKEMREASKQLSSEKELLSRDRDIPNLPSRSK